MKKTIIVSSLAALTVTGCTIHPTFSPSQEKEVTRTCIEEVQAPGTYSISPGKPSASNSVDGFLPRASPVKTLGGTEYGASAINSCIRRRANL